jgi:hypothetical protein
MTASLVVHMSELRENNGKKLLSSKPVVRTRSSYKIFGLIKRQKSFQGLAMYANYSLTSLEETSTKQAFDLPRTFIDV